MAINSIAKNSFSLPPEVIGKVRGVIIFKITDITINRTPNAVNLHLLWWGENVKNFQVLGPIRITKKPNFQTVTLVYNICTSLKLFYSYLSQCDPLKVEIFTAISNLKLGISYIPIPQDLYTKSKQNQATNVFKINNEDGDYIGDLCVDFEIVLKEKELISEPIDLIKYDVPCSKLTYETLKHKSHKSLPITNYVSENRNHNKKLDHPKTVTEPKIQDDIRSESSKDSTDLAITSRENVLKFLHGEDMSHESEKQALKDIRNISPASSLIALADAEHCLTKNTKWSHCPSNIGSKFGGNSSENTQKDDIVLKYLDNIDFSKNLQKHAMALNSSPKPVRIKSGTNVKIREAPVDNIINHIDSIRVTIQTLTLTRAGLRIVLGLEDLPLVTISSNVTFFVEYSMPSIGKQSDNTNLSRIRICSKSKDGQEVQFNRQSVHKIPLSEILNVVSNPIIVLNIYYRKLSQRQPKHLGQCRITLKEILSSPKFHSTRKCPVVTSREEKMSKDVNRKNSNSNHKMNNRMDSEAAFSDVIGFGGILAGHLTVKVELGSGMLHFGKHFLESYAANQENISLPSTITNNDTHEEIILGQKSLNQNKRMIPNPNLKPLHHVQHPIDRCAICRDYYTGRPNSQKPHDHFIFEKNAERMNKISERFSSHTQLCDTCSNTVLKKFGNQAQNSKVSGFYLDHPNGAVQDSDDGKFVNTDLRGGKDLFGGQDSDEQKGMMMKKPAMKKAMYFKRDRGKIADMEMESRNEEEAMLLHGLLFVNEARGLEPQLLPQAYCLVNRGLSPGTGGSSQPMMCDGKYFQYLETFPLLCNKALMDRCHSGHLIIEIWLKGPGPAQKLVGVASLPLHAFFVAYHDPSMVRYLEKVKLPVISVDGWIPLLSPISGTVSGEIQALLAVGTERQLEELRTSRNLKPDLVQMLDDSAFTSMKPNKAMKKVNRNEKNQKRPKVASCSIGVNTSPIIVRQFATSISELNSEETDTKSTTDAEQDMSPKNFNTVHTQTVNEPGSEITMVPEEEPEISPTSKISTNAIPLKKPQSFGNLSTFVEQLMTNLPEKTPFLTNFEIGATSKSQTQFSSKHPQIKQTSELLEELQRALEHVPNPPNLQNAKNIPVISDTSNTPTLPNAKNIPILSNAPNLTNVPNTTNARNIPMVSNAPNFQNVQNFQNTQITLNLQNTPETKINSPGIKSPKNTGAHLILDTNHQFRALIEIEQALHLAMVNVSNKKCNKRTKCKSRLKNNEISPSTYVTFGGFGSPTVDAPEGPLITTKVVNNSCSPQWKERFEVMLPVDLLSESKNLVFKIWRKAASSPSLNSTPSPNCDVVMGFAVIDLSILLTGLPSICGWFNIHDVSHRCNGQIKISVTPLESLAKFVTEESYCCSDNDTIHSLSSSINQDHTLDRITKSKEKLMSLLQDLPTHPPPSKSPDKMDLCDNDIVKSNLETRNQNHTQHKTADVNLNIDNNTHDPHCPNLHQKSTNNDPHYHKNSNMRFLNIDQPNRSPNDNTLLSNILNQNPEDDSLNTTSLSRVLKRKFTELHEITQRLRSRLLDVTADDEDEFERDLNTEGNEQEFDIRPEDFQSLTPVLPDAIPEESVEPKIFDNLANDYQNMLAGKQSVAFRCTEQPSIDIEAMQKELENNRDILLQKKCNINALLQKLTLISHPSQKPQTEKHVKFNSAIEVHHKISSNIFDMISGTDFSSPFNNDQVETESSIESTATETFYDKEQDFGNMSPIVNENEEQVQQTSKDCFAQCHSMVNIGQYDYSNDQMGQFRQSVNQELVNYVTDTQEDQETSGLLVSGLEGMEMVQKSSDDDFENDGSEENEANVSVNDVIANILRITDQCPSSSKDTGFGQDEDGSSNGKQTETGSERSKKDPDTTGIESDFDY